MRGIRYRILYAMRSDSQRSRLPDLTEPDRNYLGTAPPHRISGVGRSVSGSRARRGYGIHRQVLEKEGGDPASALCHGSCLEGYAGSEMSTSAYLLVGAFALRGAGCRVLAGAGGISLLSECGPHDTSHQ